MPIKLGRSLDVTQVAESYNSMEGQVKGLESRVNYLSGVVEGLMSRLQQCEIRAEKNGTTVDWLVEEMANLGIARKATSIEPLSQVSERIMNDAKPVGRLLDDPSMDRDEPQRG
jgi:hypothetical protein